MISLKKESESRMIRRRPQIGSRWLEEGFKVFNFRYPDFTLIGPREIESGRVAFLAHVYS